MDAITSAASSIANAVKQGFESPHDIARTGFGSGTNEHYDRARPSYPAESLQQIHSALSSAAKSRPEGLNVLELGSGTGLFSRLLLAPPSTDYPTFKIHALYAVEPSEGMRDQWTKSLDNFIAQGKYSKSSASGEVETLSGGFQELSAVKERVKVKGEKEQWADLVIAAQAWHWCHPEYEAALREITPVLASDGVFILIWNYEDRDTRYPQPLKDFEYSLENDSPQQRRNLWEATFDSQFYKDNFVEERGERKRVHWTSVVSDQKRIDRILSKSYVAMRPEAEKEQIVAKIKEFLAADDNQEWVDKEAGTYIQRWWTDVIIMRRK